MIEAGNIDFIFGLIVGIVTGAALMVTYKTFRANPTEIVPKK
jgi:hypothetical protein